MVFCIQESLTPVCGIQSKYLGLTTKKTARLSGFSGAQKSHQKSVREGGAKFELLNAETDLGCVRFIHFSKGLFCCLKPYSPTSLCLKKLRERGSCAHSSSR